MKLSNKTSIRQLVISAVALGLKNVIIAPGSRNAPLIISFNQHPGINCTSIRDERSAGFFALGKAIELKEPVGLLCTSGSAALNFAPAIVEAYYQRIPLIVFTADRPVEWIGQGDGQTINQQNIYNNYIRKSYNLNGDARDENELWYNLRCLNEGFAIATKTDPGPVHFNIHLSEPLFDTSESESFEPKLIELAETETRLPLEKTIHLQKVFSRSSKVMVLAGQHSPDEKLNALVAQLAENTNTIILSEATTNLHHPDFVENIDRCIMPMKPEEIPGFMPDLLITIGGAVVSKKIKELLRKNKPAQHWNIHPHDEFIDTYKALTLAIPVEPAPFLQQFLENLKPVTNSGFKQKWIQWASRMKDLHPKYFKDISYSDLSIFAGIYKKIPSNLSVHFSNSSPIRYAQLFDNSTIKSIHCNRGTSGIDGCTSTAMGAASSFPEQQYLLITGDVAFFYDNNAFWNEKLSKNIKIILINNAGGGIFRIIKGPSQTNELEEFFETKQTVSAKKMVEFYGWKYLSANSEDTLTQALDTFFDSKTGSTVLEIFTPNLVNSRVLAGYFKFLENTEKKFL
jgi:2-succinyl-5-enolpyruvyl-6-hydroxy-3-cyclohexene-1-carboxylate synthase